MTTITIYTDGSCPNNGRSFAQAGWGCIIADEKGNRLELAGPLEGDQQTNNRAELTAAIKGLAALKNPSEVDLFTDSEYVQKGCSLWMPKWKVRGWKGSNKKPVKNADLWLELDSLLNLHTVHFHWVKGHSGNSGNDQADALASLGALGQEIERRSAQPLAA